MITVKTTSGSYTLDSFVNKPVTAAKVIEDARIVFPHLDLRFVSHAGTGKLFRPDEVVPDGSTVIATNRMAA